VLQKLVSLAKTCPNEIRVIDIRSEEIVTNLPARDRVDEPG
jgi:hypothetical protein